MRRTEDTHLSMLCDMSEIASLLVGSENIEGFLQRTVVMVAEHLRVPVCSIYLYDEMNRELALKATRGLNPGAVDRVRMKLGEGLVGKAMEICNPILKGSVKYNPEFKYFNEAYDGRYESFLAIPITRGKERIGVIVVQHEGPNYFGAADAMALRGIAAQLAGVIANARLLIGLDVPTPPPNIDEFFKRLRFVKGRSASGGFAFGLSAIFDHKGAELGEEIITVGETSTVEDFKRSLSETARQLEELQRRLFERLPEAASLIFDAHHMILKDAGFSRRVFDYMGSGKGAAEAVRLTANHYIKLFSSSSHEALREKALDVEDLALRIIANLQAINVADGMPVAERVIVTDMLYPSDMLRLVAEDVRGAVLVGGGLTSHVSILSRSLQFPLVLVDNKELLGIPRGIPILLDADLGNVYVDPAPDVVEQFETRNKTRASIDLLSRNVRDVTLTRDGERIRLMANINILGELEIARALKAEGVGLYRTEFPYLVRSSYPSEEEQYQVYRKLFSEMEGRPVVIRTLDLAGDKMLPYAESRQEDNPQLGLRSIRFLFENKDIFEQQVRAVLRAGAGFYKMGILFPLVSSLDEFREARDFVLSCVNQMQKEGLPCNDRPSIGLMIEVPALVDIIDDVAEAVDFASIGTNDLVQYMLAADRGNDKVAKYYQPFHPSVLRSIKKIVTAFSERGKEVSLCGEKARDKDYLPFLAGVGVRILSIDPRYIPEVQRYLRELDMSEARAYAERLVGENTVAGVLKQVGDWRESAYDPLYSHGSCNARKDDLYEQYEDS